MPLRRETLAEGDYLILKGDADTAARFAASAHLAFREEADTGEGEKHSVQSGFRPRRGCDSSTLGAHLALRRFPAW